MAASGVTSTLRVPDQRVIVNNSSPSQTATPLVILSNSEIARISISGVGTRSDPYILDAREIDIAGTCVHIENTTAFFVLQGGEYTVEQSFPSQYSAILLNGVRHGTIKDCHTSGGEFGIQLQNTQDCSIISSITKDASKGIFLDGANNCTVSDSVEFHNDVGISLLETTNTLIRNNTIYANTQTGIDLDFYSQNNAIYQNRIGWNTNYNAFDNGQSNNFTNGQDKGNEWSDYSGSGNYTIEGNDASTDSHATLLQDNDPPVISHLNDRVIDVENTEEYLKWECTDEFPDTYAIYINDEIVTQGLWEGKEISFQIDQLPIGVHQIRLTAIDAAGNSEYDFVVVTVMSYMLGGIGTQQVMIASGVTVAVFLVVIIIIKKFL